MGFALLCFVICGFMMWGMLAKFGESIHDELVEPGIYVYVIVSSTSTQSPYSSITPTLFYKETL